MSAVFFHIVIIGYPASVFWLHKDSFLDQVLILDQFIFDLDSYHIFYWQIVQNVFHNSGDKRREDSFYSGRIWQEGEFCASSDWLWRCCCHAWLDWCACTSWWAWENWLGGICYWYPSRCCWYVDVHFCSILKFVWIF